MTSTSDVRTRVLLNRKVAAACGAAVLLLGVSACGSSGNADANAGTARGYGQAGQHNQGGRDGQFPGASGKVAAVDGSTAQVQGMQGQVAVTWTGDTTFTKEVSANLDAVKVGTCVFVAPDSESSSSTPSTEVTAASVRITARTNGSCTGGMGRPGGGDNGPQLNGTPPTGDRARLRGFGGAAGEVTAVSATGFTVSAVTPGSSTRTVTVTVGGATTYTTTATGAASDVKVGVCVQAVGTTDGTGAVTAKTIAVSQPRDGQCGGFVRLRSGDGGTTQGS